MDSLFTILCATRNCEDFISNTIKSVLNQTYTNWEMIIIDDCSDDNTYKIVSSFQDRRIKFQRNSERLHCGSTYAKMLQMASGEYCGVLDGDDMLKEEAISTIIKYYKKYPQLDFIWTKHRWCNKDMSRDKQGISNAPKCTSIYKSEKGFKHVYSHWRTFKTCLRERANLFKNMKCTVDKELGYTLEEVGNGGFLPLELYLYRYHKNNMSHHSNQRNVWAQVRINHADKKRRRVVILDI